jgi:hypothetical protein
MDEFCGFDQIFLCVKIIVEVMVVIKFVRDFLGNCDHVFKQMIESSVFTCLSNVDLKIVHCTTRVDMMSISHENEIWGPHYARASNGRMRYGQSSRVVQFIFSTTSVAKIK